jgi:tetratricopeptide (TPR) repeat protein
MENEKINFTNNTSDEEKFEDANERVVNELIEEVCDIKVSKEDNSDTEENFEEASSIANDLIDDESQKDFEKDQTDEERESARLSAIELKDQGNIEFKSGNYEKSIEIYTSALQKCPVLCSEDRSIIYGNRAFAKQKLAMKPAAIDDCSKAIEFNPKYVKALLRYN